MKKKGYRFTDGSKAVIFKQQLQTQGFFGAQIRKGLPEYRGQAETGYIVWHKARTIADELQITQIYKQLESK